jgi:hypothetical protein
MHPLLSSDLSIVLSGFELDRRVVWNDSLASHSPHATCDLLLGELFHLERFSLHLKFSQTPSDQQLSLQKKGLHHF